MTVFSDWISLVTSILNSALKKKLASVIKIEETTEKENKDAPDLRRTPTACKARVIGHSKGAKCEGIKTGDK
jgi:hypothetical protein